MKSAKLLFDTDVLIDYLRDEKKAVTYIEALNDTLLLSVITVAELYAGIRDKKEQDVIEQFLEVFQVIPLSSEIAKLGGALRCQYKKSHGTGLADALIAATALTQHATLITLNKRHYPMIDAVLSPYRKT